MSSSDDGDFKQKKTTTAPPSLIDLGLEFDDDEEHPCRVVPFSFRHQRSSSNATKTDNVQLIAYGGDDGIITTLTAESSPNDDAGGPKFSNPKVARTYDEEGVRAVAVSQDGKRVAVGFQSGRTIIYKYDDFDGTSKHPFCKPMAMQDGAFASQNDNSDDDDGDESAINDEDRQLTGPQLQAPIRQIVFLSSNSSTKNYHMAIASEHSFCIVDVTSEASIRDGGRLLEKDCDEHHSGSGIRGMAFDSALWCLATLSMDGRLCLWDLQATSPSSWKLGYREKTACIPRSDTGESFGADSWDRSCRPLFVRAKMDANAASDHYVVTPGQLKPLIRKLHRNKSTNAIAVQEVKLNIKNDESSNGHVEAIVQFVDLQSSHSNIISLLSSGRGGHVVQWRIQQKQSTNDFDSDDGDDNDDEVKYDAVCARVETDHFFPAVDLQCLTSEATSGASTTTAPTVLLMTSAKAKSQLINVDMDVDALSNVETLMKKNNENQQTLSQPDAKKCATINTDISDLLVDSDDDDDDDGMMDQFETQQPHRSSSSSSSSMKKRTSSSKTVAFLDDEADEDDGDIRDVAKPSKATTNPESGLHDLLDDDDGDNSVNDSGDDIQPNSDFNDPDSADTNGHKDDGVDPNANANANGLASDEDEDDLLNAPHFRSTTADNNRMMMTTFGKQQPSVPPQAPFAPSSTPLDLARRFLCWNHIGTITLMQGDEFADRAQQRMNTVDITFTDSAFRRPINFTDNQGFIMGSLGEDGGIFATDLQMTDDDEDELDKREVEDAVGGLKMSDRTKEALRRSRKKRRAKNKDSTMNPTGSSLYFHRFQTFGSARDKDWYLTLPDGERALGTACGQGWAAVATSRRFLRFFTSGGNQKQMVWLQGDLVSMTGRSRYLTVVYHINTPAVDGTQQLGYSLFDAMEFKLVSSGPLSCISKEAGLSWLGFSNDASVMAMDTDGMLSMLTPTNPSDDQQQSGSLPRWEWTPVLDTVGLRKSADDQFWPITVHDGKLVCVPLKGGNQFPDAVRKPVTTSLGLRLPLARSTIARNTVLEEVSVRSNMALAHKRTMHEISSNGGADEDDEEFEEEYTKMCAQVDKVTLKLFAAVLDAGKLERALDLVDRLHLEKSYDIAAKLSDRHEKLVQLIEDARDDKFAYPDDEEDDMQEDGYHHAVSSPSAFTTTNRRKPSPVSPTTTTKTATQGRKRLFQHQSNSDDPIRSLMAMKSKKKQRVEIF